VHVAGADRTDKVASQSECDEHGSTIYPACRYVAAFSWCGVLKVWRDANPTIKKKPLDLFTGNPMLPALWPIAAVPVESNYFHNEIVDQCLHKL
jgi:hypothetical protein